MVNPIDVRGDGLIDRSDWTGWTASNDDASSDDILKILGLGGKESYAVFSDIEAKLNGGQPFSPNAGAATPQEARTKLMERILKQMQSASGADAAKAEALKEQLKQQVMLAKHEGVLNLDRFSRAAGMEGGSKAMAMTSSQSQVQTPGAGTGGAQGPAAMGTGAGGAAAMATFPPAGWSAQTAVPQFNSSAYMQAQVVTQNAMSAWDSINQNTNRGKQLMMLFFYFAKMAESGDMGAMYQFMKFITYIISKDKAKQQIEMGKKLIELQDMSRQWTNRLLNLSTNSNDPNASNELMKEMTIVKSETDAIATSQKLISQMMEEFAQVVETLTNTTKSALETAGRIMRTVSTMR